MRPTALGLLRAAYVVAAALTAATVLPRLGVPAAWTPDLVLIGVVATAVLRGPLHGAVVGLAAGWVVELIPPVGRPLGLTALVMMLAGAVAGAIGASSLRSALRASFALVAAALLIGLSRTTVVAVAQGTWEATDALTAVVATSAAALVVLPVLTVVDHSLVRRRLG
jgi:rod shape-determining protein MreD